MDKVRILQVITKADWAGAQRVVYELCKYIKTNKQNELEIEVAVGDSGLLVQKLKNLGVKVHILHWLKHDLNPVIDYKGYKEMKQMIFEGNYDIVHCHSTKAGILGRLAAHRLKVKKILFTVHGFWPILQYRGLKRGGAILVERMLERITTDMVFISKADIEAAKRFKLYHFPKVRLIYNSITMPDEIKGVLKSELCLKDNVRIIGNVSRVDKVKNPIRFIEIAREYYHQYPKENTVFIWIGDGPLMDQIILLLEKERLKDRIYFIGFRDNVERYMVDFNLLLMTSDWEGVPIAILEALSLKIPVLSTDVGGIREIISEKNVFKLTQENREIAIKLNDIYTPIHTPKRKMAAKYVKLYLNDNEEACEWE